MPTAVPWTVNPPTSDNDLHNLTKVPGEYGDFDSSYLNQEILKTHTKYWFPEMQSWRVKYGDNGLSAAQQVWIAPWMMPIIGYGGQNAKLPVAIRQLLSWNRERYAYLNSFWDLEMVSSGGVLSPKNLQRPLVVKDVELVPRPDLLDDSAEHLSVNGSQTSLGIMGFSNNPTQDTWNSNNYAKLSYVKLMHDAIRLRNKDGDEDATFANFQQVFPRVRSQYWQVNVTWEPDPYINRWGIRYAKVEVSPSLRLESLKNVPAGVVPTKTNGQPEFEKIDIDYTVDATTSPATMGNPQLIDPLTTGFPMREPQITFKISYPWVSLTDLMNAGPIGNPNQFNEGSSAVVNPQYVPPGLYLGCVNKTSFLGFPRGRVLYNSAELRECTSPITGKIGYEITHEFIVNPNMEWNQTRYSGKYNPSEFTVAATDGNIQQPQMATDLPGFSELVTSPWKTGFIVQLEQRSGFQKVYRVAFSPLANNDAGRNWQAVYPYPYKDLASLLYYGMVGDTTKFDPATTSEG